MYLVTSRRATTREENSTSVPHSKSRVLTLSAMALSQQLPLRLVLDTMACCESTSWYVPLA